jgi:hypothetical protein
MIARMLQLSDFHFCSKLTQEGRAFYKRPFLFAKAKRHSYVKLVALSREIERIKLEGRRIDVLLATGDLSTDGAPLSQSLCLEFIESDAIRRGPLNRPIVQGLGFDAKHRILLPGNHDRFNRSWVGFQMPGAAFEQRLKTPTTYPYAIGYRQPGALNHADQPALIVFVFDSTPGGFFRFTWPWHNIARGRVEHGEIDFLWRKSKDINDNGTVPAMDGTVLNVRYSNCVRVAVLHHHPKDDNPNTLMENSDDFIEYCFQAGIHLVLFGHGHREFCHTLYGNSRLTKTSPHKMTLFCCPSATEYSSVNGFFIFDFDITRIRYLLYKWSEIAKAFCFGRLDGRDRFKPGFMGEIQFGEPLN